MSHQQVVRNITLMLPCIYRSWYRLAPISERIWPVGPYTCSPPVTRRRRKVKSQALHIGKQRLDWNTICEWNGVTVIFLPIWNYSLITLVFTPGCPFPSESETKLKIHCICSWPLAKSQLTYPDMNYTLRTQASWVIKLNIPMVLYLKVPLLV